MTSGRRPVPASKLPCCAMRIPSLVLLGFLGAHLAAACSSSDESGSAASKARTGKTVGIDPIIYKCENLVTPDDGSGQPGAVCVEAKMVFNAPIDLPSRSCMCGTAAPQSGCSVPVCAEGTCATVTCPADSAVCAQQ